MVYISCVNHLTGLFLKHFPCFVSVENPFCVVTDLLCFEEDYSAFFK